MYMITGNLLLLVIALVGFIFSSASLKGKQGIISYLLGLPVGLFFYILCFIVALVFRNYVSVPFAIILAVSLVMLPILVFCYHRQVWQHIRPRPFLLFVLIFFTSGVVLTYLNILVLSFDSYYMLQVSTFLKGFPIFQHRTFYSITWADYPIFSPMLQTLSLFFNKYYSSTITPLLAGNAAALLFAVIYYALRTHVLCSKKTSLLISVAILALFASSHFIIFQSFYLNGNLFTAIYLFIFFFGYWCYDRTRETGWLIVGTLAILVYAFLRVESTLFTTIFIFLYAFQRDEKITPQVTKAFIVIGVACTLYNIPFLVAAVAGNIMTPSRRVVIVILLNLVILTSIYKHYIPFWLRKLITFPYYGILLFSVITFFVLFSLNFHNASASSMSLFFNLFHKTIWGYTWPILVFAWLVLGFKKEDGFLDSSFLFYVLLLLCLGAIRFVPFRLGWGDSANRMMTHILPLLSFLIALKCGRLSVSKWLQEQKRVPIKWGR